VDRAFVDTFQKPVCSAAMRSKRSLSGGLSLSLASVLVLSSLPGCQQLEELTGGKKEEAKPEEAKKEDVKVEEKKADDTKVEIPAEPVPEAALEAIPVEALATGLDLMLELVPEGSEFIIVRDATVVAEYVEEAMRFQDGPLATLKTGPFATDGELQKMDAAFVEAKGKIDAVKTALDSSGIDLKEGALMAEAKGGAAYFVFKAPDPNALVAVGKALGESSTNDLKCKAIEDAPGYNVCAKDDGKLAAYKHATDAAPMRKLLGDALPGVDLDAANLLGHTDAGSSDESFIAVSTIPGQLYLAVSRPADPDMKDLENVQPGAAETLAQVQPGAGFVWARLSPEALSKAMSEAAGDPTIGTAAKSLTGEFVLAGSVNPGGLILQAGTTDTATLEAMLGAGYDLGKDEVPKAFGKELETAVPGAKLVFEKVPITGGTTTAQGLHLGVTGVPEAEVLKGYTGLNLDAWVFAANKVLTLAVGPDKDGIGKLVDVTAGGPATATLDALPRQLAEGLGRNEVGLIVHMPIDFLHGAQLHSLARAALKDVPEAPPEQLIALAGLLAPFSSGTMWITKTGDKPVVHMSVQAIGNRATDEGKAALDAAHTVADGGDPAAAFTALATAYAASPMAWAYKTRAGTEGPGYMIGSGVGAVLAVAAVAVPVALGKRNAALAEDLGVKPEAPPPELVPTTAPKRPVTKPKPAAPKKDPVVKPVKPADDPKPGDEPKPDPVVEPKPLPPKPTPDPVPVDPGTKKKPKHVGKGKAPQ
jgi:hypothetical protein